MSDCRKERYKQKKLKNFKRLAGPILTHCFAVGNKKSDLRSRRSSLLKIYLFKLLNHLKCIYQ